MTKEDLHQTLDELQALLRVARAAEMTFAVKILEEVERRTLVELMDTVGAQRTDLSN
jgi:hypothetical protein